MMRFMKWSLGLSLVASTAYFISEVVTWRYVSLDPNAPLPMDMLDNAFNRSNLQLDNNYFRCIISPSKVFCLLSPDNKLVYVKPKSKKSLSNSASMGLPETRMRHPLYLLIVDFLHVMSNIGVEPCLIEPSLLFCMIHRDEKMLLQRRGINMSILIGTSNVVTFAINSSDSQKIDELGLSSNNYGFAHYTSRRPIPGGFDQSAKMSESFIVHHFLVRRLMVVHLVVLYQRESYLWYSALDQVPAQLIHVVSKEDLLFSKHDSAFNNFQRVPLVDNDISMKTAIMIPSEPSFFLFQIGSSKFLECPGTSSSVYKNLTKSDKRKQKSLEQTFLKSRRKIGEVLKSFMMNYFIFGGTLLGWYRDCNIIPYTTDIDFGAWSADLSDDVSLVKTFSKWPCTIHVMGIPQEAYEFAFYCFKKRVDLFFLYKTKDSYWTPGHRPSRRYYFRYNYPKFSLCTADLLGQLVKVPCNTEEILVADYGPRWRDPVRDWNYEVSPKNRGPIIRWARNRTDVFTVLNGTDLK